MHTGPVWFEWKSEAWKVRLLRPIWDRDFSKDEDLRLAPFCLKKKWLEQHYALTVNT